MILIHDHIPAQRISFMGTDCQLVMITTTTTTTTTTCLTALFRDYPGVPVPER